MKTKKLLLSLVLFLSTLPLFADGGMWTLDKINTQIAQMKKLGLKLEANDIYDPLGNPDLQDAVVFFDGGCSGVLVSSESLLLTNHHCGYDKIQQLSSVEANYLRDGYMSKDYREELPCPGLEVEMVREIRDVTKEVQELLRKNKKEFKTGMEYLSPQYLSALTPQIIKNMEKKGYRYEIKAFYGGNKYYMFINKVFKDVRLVATPPSAIGKFGADTDNWMWPRHTGDFSIFRLYADNEGNSYEYNKNNKPYKAPRWAKVSGKGVDRDDFVMIMGFPGRTYHYFTDAEVDEWGNIDNNIRIEMRGIRQDIMMEAMRANEATNIQYAAKYANSQNVYKRAQGANWAIEKRHLVEMKKQQQMALLAEAEKMHDSKAISATNAIAKAIQGRKSLRRRLQYLTEGVLYGIEAALSPIPSKELFSNNGVERQKAKEKLKKDFHEKFFNKDYDPQLDRKIAKGMLERYCQRIEKKFWPKAIQQGVEKQGSIVAYVDYIFDNSVYASKERFDTFIQQSDYTALQTDPMLTFASSIRDEYLYLSRELLPFDAPLANAQKDLINAHMQYAKGKELWPDANLTLRFTYGKVQGYIPRDNVAYGHQTTMIGIMEKEDPTNPEYVVPDRLKQIYQNKEYGPYANKDGLMPVNFCATTHTTGGNSGSPVFNAKGELVGLNFDRNWEGVGGDIEYLPDYQRSIILDIRYLLLIVDKFGGGSRLIQEIQPVF